jgi:hypothetical protein
LDLGNEIRSVAAQSLGDTVLIDDGNRAIGFAICHIGPGSEAGRDACYLKFGVVRPAAGEAGFDRLLAACEALAFDAAVHRLEAGVNTGRRGAYRQMLRRGFRTAMPGVAMDRPDQPGYNRPDVYLSDDWR